MAAFRNPFPQQNFNENYSRNNFMNNTGMRERLPVARSFPRDCLITYPHLSNRYDGITRYPGNPPFRCRLPMGPSANRLYSGHTMYQERRPYGAPNFRNSVHPRSRGPVFSNDPYFLPWNQCPRPFFRPRMPRNGQHSFETVSTSSSQEKKKRKKKKKYKARPREDSKKVKPWMTDEIYDEVKKKNELFLRAKNEDKEETWQEFKMLRNKVSSMIKEAKLKGGFMTRKIKEEDDVERHYLCDACDRAFVMSTELVKHYEEHVKCEIAGCDFNAHPKIVDLHKKTLHETGYAELIKLSDDKADVLKWINERKRNYPTAENIRKHKAELQEKIDLHEIASTEFGKFEKRRISGEYIKGQDGQLHTRNQQRSNLINDLKTAVPVLTINNTIFTTSNCSVFENTNNSLEIDNSTGLVDAKCVSQTSLEEDVTRDLISRHSHASVMSLSEDDNAFDDINEDDSDKFGEDMDKQNSENWQLKGCGWNQSKDPEQLFPSGLNKHNLLDKLLANEVRHERNVVLQCIHHIVKNNFFK